MDGTKTDIINRLQRDILALQGFTSLRAGYPVRSGELSVIKAFPNEVFPLGAVHEFITASREDVSATAGFMAGLVSTVLPATGVIAWVGAGGTIFPPALEQFGIEPDRVIFFEPLKKREIQWTVEEALRCEAFSAVVAAWSDISFTESRRLQLAVEKTNTTGFIIRHNPKQLHTTPCVARWKVTSLHSRPVDDLPGVGFPKWNVELLKVRNGKPGNWIMEWAGDHLQEPVAQGALIRELRRKTG